MPYETIRIICVWLVLGGLGLGILLFIRGRMSGNANAGCLPVIGIVVAAFAVGMWATMQRDSTAPIDKNDRSDAKYDAIIACEKAVRNNFDGGDHAGAASSMWGHDAGTEATRDSSGTWTVHLQRAGPSGQSCPSRLLATCTVSGGKTTVTKPFEQDGYISC